MKTIFRKNLILIICIPLLFIQCSKKGTSRIEQDLSFHSDIPFQVFYPKNMSRNQKLPLILWLHGSGERGADNQKQLKHIVPILISDSLQTLYPSVVITPQCPEQDYWAPVKRMEWTYDSEDEETDAMKAVEKLMQKIRKTKNIDSTRIYVAGLSMGGFGALDILARHPEWFSAGIVMCGGADLANVPAYVDVPLWIFHGAKDDVVPVELSRQLVAKLESMHAHPKYTEYPDGNHGIWNAAIMEDGLMQWLFSQSKKNNKK